MPGRKFSGSSLYRYGFNGQERSTELGDDSYTAEFWQYDSRLVRRWNVDPVPFADESVYATNKNNPIMYNDPNGDCPPGVDCDGDKKKKKASGSSAGFTPTPTQRQALQKDAILTNTPKFIIVDPHKKVEIVVKPQAAFKQGGYMGSDGYKITKARFDQAKEILPGISDINDAYQAFEHGIKGEYGMMALSLASLVPGADFITKPLKFASKYADEAAKLVKQSGVLKGGREILTVTKTGLRTDAFTVTKAAIGDLGDDAIPLMGKSTSKYPDANKIAVGMQSADGTRGWRIDFDPEKGAHYNWFNNNTGEKGAVFFEGTADQVHQLKQMMTKSL